MATTPDEYRSIIAEIDARIVELRVMNANALAAATTDITPGLVSEQLAEELNRPYESEISFLRRKRDLTSIAFAETFLQT